MTRADLEKLMNMSLEDLAKMHVAPQEAWEAHVKQANAADAKVEQIRLESAKSIDTLQQSHKAATDRMTADHKQATEDADAKHKEAVAKLTAENTKAVEDLKAKWIAEQQQIKAEVEATRAKHAKALSDQGETYNSWLKKYEATRNELEQYKQLFASFDAWITALPAFNELKAKQQEEANAARVVELEAELLRRKAK